MDLSAIQSIEPPVFVDKIGMEGYFAVMRWRVAFQDKPRELWWHQPADFSQRDDCSPGTRPVVDKHGVPTEVARMKREVFNNLLKAWSEQ